MLGTFNRDEPIAKITENLKVLRSKLGLTQGEIAGKVGISSTSDLLIISVYTH